MIYYLTTKAIQYERLNNRFTAPDNVAVQLSLLEQPISSRIITHDILLKMIDEGEMPSNNGDVVYLRSYSADILKYCKVLKNREFKLVNKLETTTTIRSIDLWSKVLLQENIPVRVPHNFQVFKKENLDRTQGFGQPFEDFIVEYIKEHNLKTFNLRPKFGSARWNKSNTEIFYGYSVLDPSSFNWDSVDTTSNAFYLLKDIPSLTIRVPIVGKKVIREACLSTTHWIIDNLVIDKNTDLFNEYPKIEEYSNKIIDLIDLEIGHIDFHVVNGELMVFDLGNLDQDNPNPYDLTPLLVEYLSTKHAS
jgi:hypothetical protein